MTIEQKMQKRLEKNGMFESQAEKVMLLAKNHVLFADLDLHWKDEEYPDMLLASVWISIREVALEWIDQNIPKAWYRDMFV